MKFTQIHISNYKGLRETGSPLSNFVCAIGENNAGKSSLLQALLLFINGPKLSKAEFYDPGKDIIITVTLSGITEEALARVAEDHRTKIIPLIDNEKLTLARRYATDGSCKLRVVTDIPKDTKFHSTQVDDAFKGKKGTDIANTMVAFYPEVADAKTAATLKTQKVAKDLIEQFVAQLPADQLKLADIPLPTGIDNSIRALLPEPIYIPAVKDLSDELKTKESASFGKLLNILLDVIEDDLTDTVATFENLHKKLNCITQEDGSVTDERMDKVRDIESTIQRNLEETFRNVSIELEIPPPDIKTVLSNANIVANDGVRGPIENKGDGFKRAITFSILRSYVQLSQNKAWRRESEQEKPTKDKFLFLFEEPELYLHPRAQNILFDALALIAERHQVLVTTHSPLFFSADDTTTFVKLVKQHPSDQPKPVGKCLPIDLTDLGEKDRFQLISFETSNLAFFSSKIILVEGDSDLIILPHIARLLDTTWDFKTTSTNLVKINGKGSFRRYREFFKRFAVDVAMLTDLDIITRDFDKIDPSTDALELRAQLLQEVDRLIDDANAIAEPSPRLLRAELQRDRALRILAEIQDARSCGDVERQTRFLEEFFAFERTEPRLEILKDHSRKEIVSKKRLLLSKLRSDGVFVLEKGTIEDYYPEIVAGPDKPTKAQSFCSNVTTADEVRRLCHCITCNGENVPELEVIIKGIFSG